MLSLKVLGKGCQQCGVLAQRAELAARELGVEYQIEKVTDAQLIARSGILSTPALVVNGHVRLEGQVPTVDKLKELLR
jgi:small redox-active disulfide protein 2